MNGVDGLSIGHLQSGIFVFICFQLSTYVKMGLIFPVLLSMSLIGISSSYLHA
jgi:hypothetical protein